MLVDITARVIENSSLAPNHPTADWPISLVVDQNCDSQQRRILDCKGSIRAGELRAVVMKAGNSAPDSRAIPSFVTSLMNRELAMIRNVEIPQDGIEMLLNLALNTQS